MATNQCFYCLEVAFDVSHRFFASVSRQNGGSQHHKFDMMYTLLIVP